MGQVIALNIPYGPNLHNSDILSGCPASTLKRLATSSIYNRKRKMPSTEFIDLNLLPPELALTILSNLNATDLCLASCVWRDLAFDEMLWQSLCRATWPYCSNYNNWQSIPEFSFRQLYLRLDEFRLTFNADAFEGVLYLFKYGIVDDSTEELTKFFTSARGLCPIQRRRYLDSRHDVLDGIVQAKDFSHQFLPNALRMLFIELPAPSKGPFALDYVSTLVDMFSDQFAKCNPQLGMSADTICVLCYSLIMLSVDLWSPHVKNKMSKREFIRNTRYAAQLEDDELLGHLYDNVYTVGHVAADEATGPFPAGVAAAAIPAGRRARVH